MISGASDRRDEGLPGLHREAFRSVPVLQTATRGRRTVWYCPCLPERSALWRSSMDYTRNESRSFWTDISVKNRLHRKDAIRREIADPLGAAEPARVWRDYIPCIAQPYRQDTAPGSRRRAKDPHLGPCPEQGVIMKKGGSLRRSVRRYLSEVPLAASLNVRIMRSHRS